jgi:hypothetical protein
MPSLAPLSTTYRQARSRFLDAAAQADAAVVSHVHPARGLEGEELAVDVAEFGPVDAPDVVLIVSATHGVEGYAGSALQDNWLRAGTPGRTDRVRTVLIHALNPYGFSWVRRVNEDNVDLNRNFIDWNEPPPTNPDYDEIADLLVPSSWDEAEQQRTSEALWKVVERVGAERLQHIVSSGQFAQPDGLFYGGAEPAWSNRWIHRWCATSLAGCRRLTVVDLHTGLGPWGVGEAICVEEPGDPAYERAKGLWGAVTSMVGGDSSSAVLVGDWLSSPERLAPGIEVTSVCLEYGTVDPIVVLQALRADAWLHAHGDPSGPDGAEIRRQVRAAFADDDPAWLDVLWPRFLEIVGPALDRP